jgi:CBS domain-containing protein
MELTRIAKRPALTTTSRSTVRDVCASLKAAGVGALAVVDGGNLVGIISERDVVVRVVASGRDPHETLVSDVMTSPVRTVTDDVSTRDALQLMHEGRFRHLPVLDRAGHLVGMLSVRDLLRERIEELDKKNADLIAFISTDGPGG